MAADDVMTVHTRLQASSQLRTMQPSGWSVTKEDVADSGMSGAQRLGTSEVDRWRAAKGAIQLW